MQIQPTTEGIIPFFKMLQYPTKSKNTETLLSKPREERYSQNVKREFVNNFQFFPAIVKI